jgi:hypothetical protein
MNGVRRGNLRRPDLVQFARVLPMLVKWVNDLAAGIEQ